MPLLLGKTYGCDRVTAARCFLDGRIDVRDLPVKIGDNTGLDGEPCLYVGGAAGYREIASKRVDMRPGQEAIGADRIEHHEHGDQGHQDGSQRTRCVTAVPAEPRHGGELVAFEGDAYGDHGIERSDEDRGLAIDRVMSPK
jgi:hypothetical protein